MGIVYSHTILCLSSQVRLVAVDARSHQIQATFVPRRLLHLVQDVPERFGEL